MYSSTTVAADFMAVYQYCRDFSIHATIKLYGYRQLQGTRQQLINDLNDKTPALSYWSLETRRACQYHPYQLLVRNSHDYLHNKGMCMSCIDQFVGLSVCVLARPAVDGCCASFVASSTYAAVDRSVGLSKPCCHSSRCC
jgi:hypothetical protein